MGKRAKKSPEKGKKLSLKVQKWQAKTEGRKPPLTAKMKRAKRADRQPKFTCIEPTEIRAEQPSEKMKMSD